MAMFSDTINQIQRMSPGARRERKQDEERKNQAAEWASEKQGMERRLFQEQITKMTRESQENMERTKVMDAYGQLSGMVADLEQVDGLAGNELQAAVMERADKYTDPKRKELFIQSAASGDYTDIFATLSQAESKLSAKYTDFDAPDRTPMVTSSGKLLPLSKSSPIALREPNEHELDALGKINPRTKKPYTFGSDDFYQEVHKIESGGYDPVKVVHQGKIIEVPAHEAESNGMLTKEQHDFNKSADDAEKEIRDAHRKLGLGADTVRQKNTIAIDAIRKAKGVIENHTWNKPVTGPESQYAPMNTDLNMLQGYLRTIGGNVALETMSEMRKQSSSGATGFGALSKGELDLLLSTMGNIDPLNNTDMTLWEQLDKMQSLMEKNLEGYLPGETIQGNEGEVMIFLGGDPNDLENWETY